MVLLMITDDIGLLIVVVAVEVVVDIVAVAVAVAVAAFVGCMISSHEKIGNRFQQRAMASG